MSSFQTAGNFLFSKQVPVKVHTYILNSLFVKHGTIKVRAYILNPYFAHQFQNEGQVSVLADVTFQ